MKVRDLMTSSVHSCQPQDSLEQAVHLLWEHDCGILPVVDGEGHVGAALTEHDICMEAFHRRQPLSELTVADSMSPEIVACHDDDEIADAVETMANHQVFCLPVVDQRGTLCGTLSMNELATATDNGQDAAHEVLKGLAASRPRKIAPAGASLRDDAAPAVESAVATEPAVPSEPDAPEAAPVSEPEQPVGEPQKTADEPRNPTSEPEQPIGEPQNTVVEPEQPGGEPQDPVVGLEIRFVPAPAVDAGSNLSAVQVVEPASAAEPAAPSVAQSMTPRDRS